MFVLFIYLLTNVINFVLSLLNVSLRVIVFLTKVMFVMILVLTKVVYLVMLFSLRINVSFLHVESLPEIIILPYFDELSPLPERFKPGMVYTRRRPTLPLPETDPSSKSVQTISLEIDPPSEIIP